MEPVEPINHALVAVTSQGATRGPSAANAGLIFILLQRVAHAFWRWRRMRRYGELSRGAERSSARQFFPDCTIAMCGYDFREGHYHPLGHRRRRARSQIRGGIGCAWPLYSSNLGGIGLLTQPAARRAPLSTKIDDTGSRYTEP